MGIYINPKEGTKEEWLAKHAKEVNSITWDILPKDILPVVLVDNGGFTAAGIAYCKSELEQFQYEDGRPKKWFLAKVEDLQKVQPATIPIMHEDIR